MILTIQGTDGFSRSLKTILDEDQVIKSPGLVKWINSQFSPTGLTYNELLCSQENDPIRIYNVDRTAQAGVKNSQTVDLTEPYGIYVTLKQIQSQDFINKSIVQNATFLVFSDLYKLQSNPRRLFKYMLFIYEKLSTRKLLVATNIHPYFFPVLTYMGIDLFDTVAATFLAGRDIALAQSGEFRGKELMLDKNELIEKNVSFSQTMIKEIRLRIQNQTLYDFVKLSSNWNPSLRSILRFINLNTSYFAPRTPQRKENPLLCSDVSDLYRVEVVRYVQRVKNAFEPYKDTKICLILPCSARKPYSYSRSHHFFRNTINTAIGKKARMISELILTSPLGIVPRELEAIYPAAHYEISVTGQWYEEERLRIKDVLAALVPKYDPDTKFIAYLSEEEATIVQSILPIERSTIIKIKGSATAEDSLLKLRNAILKYSDQISEKTPGHQELVQHTYNMIVDFQFGKGAHERILPKDWKLKKQQNQRYIVDNGKRFAKVNNKTGLLEFYLPAADRLAQLGINRVYFNGVNFRGSSLFCAGVKKADEYIIPGDEIVLLDSNQEVIGIGEAVLPGTDMKKYDKGMATIIRKKRK